MQVYYSDHVDFPLPSGHRFPKRKYRMVRDLLFREGLVRADAFHAAPRATRDQLVAVHDAAYVDAFLSGSLSAAAVRRIGFPWSQGLVRRTLASVGATCAATVVALREGAAGTLSGGTHHAHRDFGSGFCVFNDIAIAATQLLDAGRVARIAVLDVDVHQGDGTAAIFATEPRVLTCSIHGARNFPLRKSVSDIDVPLPDGAGDDTYLAALDQLLPRVLAHNPEFVFVQAGVDPLAADRLGRLALSEGGLAERDRRIVQALYGAGVPFVLTMGGGYADPIEPSVRAYVNTYRAAVSIRGCPRPTRSGYTEPTEGACGTQDDGSAAGRLSVDS